MPLAPVASAQEAQVDDTTRVASARPTRMPHPIGEYTGLVPGDASAPPHVQSRLRRAGRGRRAAKLMTWPGFQARGDQGSRIFVQMSGEIAYERADQPNRIVVLLKNASIGVRNSRLPLETRFFNTPVARANVVRRGRDLALVLDMRNAVTPTLRTEPGPDGTQLLFVEFPAGDFLPPELSSVPATEPIPLNAPAVSARRVDRPQPQPAPAADEAPVDYNAMDNEAPPGFQGDTQGGR